MKIDIREAGESDIGKILETYSQPSIDNGIVLTTEEAGISTQIQECGRQDGLSGSLRLVEPNSRRIPQIRTGLTERLEPYAGKLARTVLRREGGP